MCYNDGMKNKKYLQFQLESQRDRADYFHAEKYLSDGYYAHFHRNAELYCVYEGAVTVTIGKAGAINAAYLAIQILSLKNDELAGKLVQDRMMKAKKVELDSSEIEVRID